MRVLALTTLYPSAARPAHGVFVENRLKAVSKRGHEIRVVAPVPFFPFKHKMFGEYADFAETPASENRFGFPVLHPRYATVPKFGMTLAAHTLELCFRNVIRSQISSGFEPDLIDAHYYYPDGVAALAAAKSFGLPTVITARGTDINLIPQFPRQRKMLQNAERQAAASICVADALRDEMLRLGADATKTFTIRNGVDLETFHPVDRTSLPAEWQKSRKTIASVGHLIERKGHHLVIEALASVPDTTLLIAGKGPAENTLKELADRLGLSERVVFLGAVPHEELCRVYSAADVLVLASSREGWPNVLLEALACGTPCIATPVWGSGEVIGSPEAGLLADDRTPSAIAQAIHKLFNQLPDRDQTRGYAEKYGWEPVAEQVERVWASAIRKKAA